MCCWDKAAPIRPAAPTPSPTVLEKLNKGVREEFERRRRFGNVRPLITTTQNGYRCIAVGSRVYFHQEWRTFTDFLLFYVRDVMGHRWSETEEAKKGFERTRFSGGMTGLSKRRRPRDTRREASSPLC